MKTLVEYIKEACDEQSQVASSKTVSFNFTGLDNAEDTLKSVQTKAEELGIDVEVEENKLKVSLKKDNVDDAEGLFELLQDFIHARRNDQKVASDEAYAQKVHSFEDHLNDWRDYVDDAKECAAAQEEADKKEEDKEKKEDDKDKKEEE